jgi:hypothetical protein
VNVAIMSAPMYSTASLEILSTFSDTVFASICWCAVYFLAYFNKMKVGLSNHQPVCLCPPLITFEPICGFSWNLVGRCCHSRWPQHYTF